MPIDSSLISTQISRRVVLGTAAVMAATPALAEVCPIGPPTHEKGPRVWMDMDQVELDAAYDQSIYAPLIGQILKRYATSSNEARPLSSSLMAPTKRRNFSVRTAILLRQ